MGKEKMIYSKRFEKPDNDIPKITEDYEKSGKTGRYPNGNESIWNILKRETTYVPNISRINGKEDFIHRAIELSKAYELDADIYEGDGCCIADFYMDFSSYFGGIKRMLTNLLMRADEVSVFGANQEKTDCDFILSMTYHTHDVFLHGKKVTELEKLY